CSKRSLTRSVWSWGNNQPPRSPAGARGGCRGVAATVLRHRLPRPVADRPRHRSPPAHTAPPVGADPAPSARLTARRRAAGGPGALVARGAPVGRPADGVDRRREAPAETAPGPVPGHGRTGRVGADRSRARRRP